MANMIDTSTNDNDNKYLPYDINGVTVRENVNGVTYEYSISYHLYLQLEDLYDINRPVKIISYPYDRNVPIGCLSQIQDCTSKEDWKKQLRELYNKLSKRKRVTIFPLYANGNINACDLCLFIEDDSNSFKYEETLWNFIGYVYIDRWTHRHIKTDEMAFVEITNTLKYLNICMTGDVYKVTKSRLDFCNSCGKYEKEKIDSLGYIVAKDRHEVLKIAKTRMG